MRQTAYCGASLNKIYVRYLATEEVAKGNNGLIDEGWTQLSGGSLSARSCNC